MKNNISKAWWNHSIDELEQAADSDGVVRDNKDYTRRNRFNGESVELTPEECKKHDDIFYYEPWPMRLYTQKRLGQGSRTKSKNQV
jgi:hypothetical protein